MLARRGRLQIKPNLAKGVVRSANKTSLPKPSSSETAEREETADTTSNEVSAAAEPIVTSSQSAETSPPPRPVTPMSAMMNRTSDPVSSGPPMDQPAVVGTTDSALSVDVNSRSAATSPTPSHLLSPNRRMAHASREMMSPRNRLTSTCETPTKQNKRRKFNGDEELDTKQMRMMDMIYWNPKQEKGLTKRVHSDSISVAEGPAAKQSTPTPVKNAAPQVKLGPDGQLILDESSLVVPGREEDTSVWETVEEDRISRKVTSLSFRNRLWRKGTPWTDKETHLFYEVLRCTGPDFGLMHEFFPSRARNELKNKYNREERLNWDKMKQVLSIPALLDDSLYERVSIIEKEIEKEAFEKKNRNKKKPVEEEEEVEWNEETADLVAEAEAIIREMEWEWNNRVEDDSSDSDASTSDHGKGKKKKQQQKKSPAKKLSKQAEQILRASRAEVMRKEAKAAPQVMSGYEETEDPEEDISVVAETGDAMEEDSGVPQLSAASCSSRGSGSRRGVPRWKNTASSRTTVSRAQKAISSAVSTVVDETTTEENGATADAAKEQGDGDSVVQPAGTGQSVDVAAAPSSHSEKSHGKTDVKPAPRATKGRGGSKAGPAPKISRAATSRSRAQTVKPPVVTSTDSDKEDDHEEDSTTISTAAATTSETIMTVTVEPEADAGDGETAQDSEAIAATSSASSPPEKPHGKTDVKPAPRATKGRGGSKAGPAPKISRAATSRSRAQTVKPAVVRTADSDKEDDHGEDSTTITSTTATTSETVQAVAVESEADSNKKQTSEVPASPPQPAAPGPSAAAPKRGGRKAPPPPKISRVTAARSRAETVKPKPVEQADLDKEDDNVEAINSSLTPIPPAPAISVQPGSGAIKRKAGTVTKTSKTVTPTTRAQPVPPVEATPVEPEVAETSEQGVEPSSTRQAVRGPARSGSEPVTAAPQTSRASSLRTRGQTVTPKKVRFAEESDRDSEEEQEEESVPAEVSTTRARGRRIAKPTPRIPTRKSTRK